MRTLQEIFDICAAHLLRQRERCSITDAEDGDVLCRYRHPTAPLKCAIGALIPDERYTPDLEGAGVLTPEVQAAANLPIDGPGLTFAERSPEVRLAWRLQNIHDHSHPLDWRTRLKEVAHEFELSYDVLNTTP